MKALRVTHAEECRDGGAAMDGEAGDMMRR